MKLSVRERGCRSIHHEGPKTNMSRAPRAVFLLQTETAIDPQVWIVSSSLSSFVKRAVNAHANVFITLLLLFLY